MKKLMYHLEYILIFPLAIMSILSAINANIVLLSVGICLFIEGICYIFLVTNKNKLKAAAGIITFINGAISIVVLLLLAISMLPNTAPLYYVIYTLIYLTYKIFSYFYYRHIKDDLMSTIYKEFAVIMIMLIINLLACILFYNFDPNESLDYMIDVLVKIFVDNYTGYDTLKFYLLVIKILINFISSFFVAYYSASAMILLLKNKPLTLKEKIRSIIDFIQKYNISFIMGEIFTTIVFLSYLQNANSNEQYGYIASFYLLILVLRTLIFIWNKIITKKYKDNPYKLYRRQFILLIIVSASIILLNQSLNSVLISISTKNNNPNAFPIWWLLLIILPFSAYGFIISFLSYKRAKMNDNAYLLAYSNLSCISSMFMLFGSTIFILAKISNELLVMIIWFILLSAVIISELTISIISLIIGIKGIAGKRKKPEDFIHDKGDE